MWLQRTESRVPIHKFACSSFKDIHLLLSDDDTGGGDTLASTAKPSICHRTRSVHSLTQPPLRENEAAAPRNEKPDPEIRIPGAERSVVVYFTSLRVVRPTFEDCNAVRSILRAFRVPIDERDLSMDSRFTDELQRILGLHYEKSELTLPRVFIGGRYIGGAEELRRLHESGDLKKRVEGLPPADPGTCGTCGGYGFILCDECSASHKCYDEKSGFASCTWCNENGLVRCLSCSCADW